MPECKFFPETHVVFVSRVGPYQKSISDGFKKLFEWLEENQIEPTGPSLGIFYDDPARVAEGNLRCDLCAPIGPDTVGSGEVRTKEIGGWTVATTLFEGEENSRRAYTELYDWLRQEGYHEADAPIEKYLSRLGEQLKVELAVPVVEKKHLPGGQKVKAAGKKPRAASAKPTKANQARATKPSRKTK